MTPTGCGPCSSSLRTAGASRAIGPATPTPCSLLLGRPDRAEPGRRGRVAKSVAMLFDYAEYLVPAGDLDTLARGQAARLVRFLRWAQNPLIKQVNMAFCLIADRLAEVNDRLVESPHVATIEIPLPDRDARCRFSAGGRQGPRPGRAQSDFSAEQLADMSNGLSLVNLNVVLSQAASAERRIDGSAFRQLKKTVIERQCRGLVEFVEPDHTLDLVAGQTEAKKRLQEDAQWITRGRLDAGADGLPDLRPGGHGQDLHGRVLCRLDRHPLRDAEELPLEVRRRDRGQPATGAGRAAVAGAGGGDRRRGRRGPGQPAGRRRLGHLGPGLLDDRRADGQHPLSRPHRLDALDLAARPAADRSEAAGPGGGPYPAVLSVRRCRDPRRCSRSWPARTS